MTDLSEQEMESIALSYQKLLVPGFFRDYAEKTLDEIQPEPGESFLDVACGTGVLARAAADRMDIPGKVCGLDMNPGMLSVARELAPEVQWTQGQAEQLPYDTDTFDIVACQFSLMFFEDKEAAIDEMLRVLKPDGRLAITVLGEIDDIPAYNRLLTIYAAVAETDVGSFLKAPFLLGDKEKLKELFTEDGLPSTNRSIRDMEVQAQWPDMESLVRADVDGWFPLAGIELDESQVDEVIRRANRELDEYIIEDGSVEFTMPAVLVTNA
jgi:ubiquinone/menaquinone biosynthesis C-methylase UbiE